MAFPVPAAAPVTAPVATYTAVPLAGLVTGAPLPFPLYLRTAADVWVLYRPAGTPLDDGHLGRLQAEGIHSLDIRVVDRAAYFVRVEAQLDRVLLDRAMPLACRADVLHGVASRVADELFAASPDRDTLHRAQKVLMATSSLLLREARGFQAVRAVLTASAGLAAHSLTVGLLAMGIARAALGADGGTLALAGLAGLLHDVGRVGGAMPDHDPAHTGRGAECLHRLGLPAVVVEVAHSHHERADGSGQPLGRRGGQIPELARLVGLCDQFEQIYSAQPSRGSVFEALRILAQQHRSCFDERFAQALVRAFRN
jgi:putative nucleotidyltransferase with HDIG domain